MKESIGKIYETRTHLPNEEREKKLDDLIRSNSELQTLIKVIHSPLYKDELFQEHAEAWNKKKGKLEGAFVEKIFTGKNKQLTIRLDSKGNVELESNIIHN